MTNGTRHRAARAAGFLGVLFARVLFAAVLFAGVSRVGPARAAERDPVPLPITIRALEPPPPRSRLEELLAKRDEAARRWRIGICRGCSRTEGPEPAGRMIEVSPERPRASWETVAPP